MSSPQNCAPSPVNTASLQLPFTQPTRWTPRPVPVTQNIEEQTQWPLRLTWNGRTRAQLQALTQEAYDLDRLGNIEIAENKYRTALDGLQHLLAPTHEETKKVAYQLVSFYAQHDRMDDADAVLGWMCDKLIDRWGIDHKRTVDHLLYILELFNHWSRVDDAIALISRAFEAFGHSDDNERPTDVRSALSSGPWIQSLNNLLQRPQTISEVRAFDATDKPAMMTYQIGLTKIVHGEAAEAFLLGLISQCLKYPDKFATQSFEAWHALITLYHKPETADKYAEALKRAEEDFRTISNLDSIWTGPLLDAAVELAKLYVKAGQHESAESILLKVESEAEILYGEDDDKLIRLLIRIGIFFQDQQRWSDARPRFEHALAASMTWSGLSNARTKRLQAALDNEHFEMELLNGENIEPILRRDWPDPNNRNDTHNRSTRRQQTR